MYNDINMIAALYNDINNARTMIEEVSGENEKVMKHINEIRNELEDLEKGKWTLKNVNIL